MPSVRTPDGAEIFYEVRGTGPVNLALVHGWGGVGGLWHQVTRHLDARQFCCWLIDSRGHGRSPPPASGYEWDDFASDILAVADQAGAERFIPVGFSLGGKVTLYLTAKYRSRVSAQILVAPVGPGPAPLSGEARRKLYQSAADWTQLKASIKDWFGPTVSEPIIDACCRAVSRTPAAVLEITNANLLSTSLPEPFNRTDAPTLVVMGERDPHYGPEYQRVAVLPFLTRVETATLPSGHFVPLEHPAELAALISAFARRMDAGERGR
jgi:pimeloyl-ACP methyl ester carboxylesterase